MTVFVNGGSGLWERNLPDVAVMAAERALKESRIAKSQVGALVSCSVCKDYIEPSVAAIVHGKLGSADNGTQL